MVFLKCIARNFVKYLNAQFKIMFKGHVLGARCHKIIMSKKSATAPTKFHDVLKDHFIYY